MIPRTRDRRTHLIAFRVTPVELDSMLLLAKVHDEYLSAMVRRLALEAVRNAFLTRSRKTARDPRAKKTRCRDAEVSPVASKNRARSSRRRAAPRSRASSAAKGMK